MCARLSKKMRYNVDTEFPIVVENKSLKSCGAWVRGVHWGKYPIHITVNRIPLLGVLL